MKVTSFQLGMVCLFLFSLRLPAAVFYVNVNNTNPVSPFTNWPTAATNIQDAIDTASNGDSVLVTNGIYQTGGRIVNGVQTVTRVGVTKAIVVQSVNGPSVTIIQGYQDSNNLNAVRCVYVATNAVLSGFTLTNGSSPAWYGGGVLCQGTNSVVSNCWVVGNSALGGGGVEGGTLNNCVISNNVAQNSGGGAFTGIFDNCLFVNNSAPYGGAVAAAISSPTILNNCTVYGNSASTNGGGFVSLGLVAPSYLLASNCIVYGNHAPSGSNYAYAFTGEVALDYCCTTPLPVFGSGNFTNDPMFLNQAAGDFHLQTNSPCINAGTTNAVGAADLDGNPRIVGGFVDLGAYEYQLTAPVGLVPNLQANYTGVATGITVNFTGQIAGHPTASRWDFGDGTSVSNNLPAISHSWSLPGDYVTALWAYNNDYPAGISASVIIHVLANPVHYVSSASLNPVAPYLSWNTAATNIQDAVNAGYVGGEVLVTNGVYAYGGQAVTGLTGTTQMNRVVITKQLVLLSVNGPAVTVIQGVTTNDSGPVRCVYLGANSLLAGFTLTNGVTDASGYANDVQIQSGGGVFCGSGTIVVSNCVLTGNSSYYEGGGAYGGTLKNCWLTGNSVRDGFGGGATATLQNCILTGNTADQGGGAFGSALYNCTLVSNTAGYEGGGLAVSTANNCIIYYNTAPTGPDYDIIYDGGFGQSGTLNYCDTSSQPAYGVGNITNDPQLLNLAADDFHLQASSPCINSGDNAGVTASTDFDGNPRIVGGTVDVGACEFQTPSSVLSYAWAQQYGLPVNGSVDYSDLDGSGMNNRQKSIAGLNPTNAASVLALLPLTATNPAVGVTVSWQSVNTRTYYLQRATSLTSPTAFSVIQSNLVGQAGITSFTDTTATNGGSYFYRIGVQ